MTNEERILAILERQEQTLEKQGQILEKHGQMLEKHGQMLEKQGQILEQHGKILEKQGQILEKHGQILEEHGQILEEHGKRLEKLQLDVSGIKVRLDVEVEQKFQLLAEGQQTILETLAPISRVQKVEDEVAFLKSIIKVMSEDIADLKKAQ